MFPVPFWRGTITGNYHVTFCSEFVHRRSGANWFVNWLYVVSGDELRSFVRSKGTPINRKSVTVGSFECGSIPIVPGLTIVGIKAFFDLMDKCGDGVYKYQVIGDDSSSNFEGMSTLEFRHFLSNTRLTSQESENPKYAMVLADQQSDTDNVPQEQEEMVAPLVVAIPARN